MKLLNRVKQGTLCLLDGEVEQAEYRNGKMNLHDKNGNLIEQTGTVLLATGFKPALPGEEWLSPVIDTYQLCCSECGYPIVSRSLQWGPNLYATEPSSGWDWNGCWTLQSRRCPSGTGGDRR